VPIRRLLRRCLEKDRQQRLPDIGAARLDIDEARANRANDVDAVPAAHRGRERALWAAALVATAIGAAAATWYARPAPPAAEVRFEIPVRPMRWANEISLSPDGRRVVYSAATDTGDQGLWIRDLGAVQPRALAGTEAATGDQVSPSWSPDGRSVVFSAAGELRTIDVDGGAPQTIARSIGGQMGGATWNREGVIVFATNNHGLRRVAATGGEVTQVSERDNTIGEVYHDAPFFLPDQRRFLYLAWSETRPENRAIYVGSLDSPSRTRLMAADSQAVYASGHLLFLRGGTLTARPFDPDILQFTGEPFPVVDGISVVGGKLGAFSASANGALIYKAVDSEAASRQLLWMDRDGKAVRASDGAFEIAGLKLSPDDTRLVFTEGNPPDVWVYDVVRGLKSRLTTDPAIDHNPIWTADGARVLFDSHRRVGGASTAAEGAAIFVKAANGAMPEQLLLDTGEGSQQSPLDASRDGRTIVFRKVAPSGVWNIWSLPLDGERKPVPYRSGPFNETEASLSPDGRWLAYSSNESGRSEVIVQPFPDPSGGKWQVSTNGGVTPRWRGDGRELYYLDASGRIVAAAVSGAGSVFSVESVAPLFRTPLPLPIVPGGALGVYDVTSDGKRFLVAVPPAGATPAPINVVLNWTAAFNR
jgi:Tol biopolymer transport system component